MNQILSFEPIDFESYTGDISTYPPELKDFCFDGADFPSGSTLRKGAQSLRVGFYKIIEQPAEYLYYNNINTHASHVLFYREGYANPIRCCANIGPLLNLNAKYGTDEKSCWHHFIQSGRFANKEKFFESLMNKEIQVIKDEWVQSEKYNTRVKKITWIFSI